MKITEKQKEFCRLIISGSGSTEAYKQAYNHHGKETTAQVNACKLLKQENIQEYLSTLRKPLEEVAESQAVSEFERIKNLTWSRIYSCISRDDDTSIARYIDILNKMNQTYINKTETVSTSENIVSKLSNEQIEKLLQ